jgi:hypothetical protein
MSSANVAILLSLATLSPRAKLAASMSAAVWVTAMITIAAAGGFRLGALGRFPTPIVAFSTLVAGAVLAWFSWPSFRRALLSIPVAALVAVNGFRIGGVLFLLLFADRRLAAPFGPSAGWGDIVTGATAV